MKLSAALSAELVALVAQGAKHARVTITGTSMQPLLRAGMVIDIEPLTQPPRVGDILVFKSANGLVAHRLIGGELFAFRAHSGIIAQRLRDPATLKFVTCGDAHPDRAEIVPRHLVIGRVSAVWASAEPGAQRIDDARYRRLGGMYARTRAIRSFSIKARAYAGVLSTDPARIARPAAFAALVAATGRFERREWAEGVARLTSVPESNAIAMARRHHLGGLLARWLEDASAAGVTVPAGLRVAFERIRWTNALQAGRVLASVRGVRDTFENAGIPHIFLKGGARLGADVHDADLQYAGDVDVLVPQADADRALAILRNAGYADIRPEHERARYASSHHREPLRSPDVGLPVEVHVTLARPAIVSQRLDYFALANLSRRVTGPVGEVCVLDAVGSALHLAYHARDLRVWRDIVLLSRLLRSYDPAQRASFDRFIAHERRDRLRVRSAVAAADALTVRARSPGRAVSRYIAWAQVREDLPQGFAHVDLIEALVGRCRIQGFGLESACREPFMWLRRVARNLVLIPSIARIAIQRIAIQRNEKPTPVGRNDDNSEETAPGAGRVT